MSNANKPRGIATDMKDALARATHNWTRQRKSEEKHPGNVRYRVSRPPELGRVRARACARYGV